jgi:plasmid maintenance system antidote protein VapI
MSSYTFDIGAKARKAARFIGQVRAELQRALIAEKAARKLTQQQIATMIGVNRSVINRQIMGLENLTLRSVAELAWALDWEISFSLRKPAQAQIRVDAPEQATRSNNEPPTWWAAQPDAPYVQTGTSQDFRAAA